MNTAAEKPSEDISIKFQEVYDSPEWKSLDPVVRAQLLLVAEGVKPGTIICGDFTHFPKILHKLWLESSLNTEEWRLDPVYMVSRKETLDQFHRWTITPPNDKKLWEYFHRLNGEFLWYPPCCTNEYCHPKKNLAARKKKSPHKFISNIDFELEKEIESTGTYPEELDFCPPSFTPCGINCPCASPLLKKWKSILEIADSDAAERLKIFNWMQEPCRKVHYDELIKKYEEYRDKIGRIIIPN